MICDDIIHPISCSDGVVRDTLKTHGVFACTILTFDISGGRFDHWLAKCLGRGLVLSICTVVSCVRLAVCLSGDLSYGRD